ncbi:CHC2 zinc finger domain-containing protein [Pedobacter sp. R-06]|uniref:CHC2 zinc finger domain-containing protein n=1 Tax=Pedobacter sp. R-06 TaxID=3404051 RepID=UPI003CEDD753
MNLPFCKNAGFSVSIDKQIYKCFKCNKGGGVINFIQKIEKKSFPAAIKFWPINWNSKFQKQIINTFKIAHKN